MARVVLEHVDKIYPGGIQAVCNLSLDVAEGEFLVVVGPSGCGKTTTLRMIAGLETATRGTIAIGPSRVDATPPRDRNVAMVFQDHALYPHMTVYRNMAFALALRKTPRAEIEARVRGAAAFLKIEALLERRPGELSGGQIRRVALGKAIVRRPDCFLFDEPLSNLDARLRIELRAELKRLHGELGTTVIHVTHDQEEALALGDRVAVLRDGRLEQIGPPDEVYRCPANRFVAEFLGGVPMNFIEGRVVRHAGRLWFDDGHGRLAIPATAARELSGRIGSVLVLGIRPEHVSAGPIARHEGPLLQATVDAVESRGERLCVRLATGDREPMRALIDPRTSPKPGDRLAIRIDPEGIRFFDSSGRAVGGVATLPV